MIDAPCPARSPTPVRPRAGTDQNRQTSRPVATSWAAMKPRAPSSPPDIPVITQIADHQRRRRRAVVLPEVGHADIPQDLPVTAMQRQQPRIVSDHEEAIAAIATPRLTPAPASPMTPGVRGLADMPDLASGVGIEGEHLVRGGRRT